MVVNLKTHVGRTEQISRHYLALRRMLWRHFSAEEPWVLEWIRIPSDTCGRVNSIWIRYVWTGKFLNPERKSCGFKNIRIRVDRALVSPPRELFSLKIIQDPIALYWNSFYFVYLCNSHSPCTVEVVWSLSRSLFWTVTRKRGPRRLQTEEDVVCADWVRLSAECTVGMVLGAACRYAGR